MTTKTFKIWDEQNATGGGGKCLIRQNFITFTSYGKVSFSSGLCSTLGLTHESRITFIEGDDGSLFLCKTINTGLIFGQSKSKKNYLQMGARKLCDHLFQTYGFDKSFRARVCVTAETFPKQEGLPVAGYRIYLNEVKK